MLTFSAEEFRLSGQQRALGVDLGEKTIGLALSDVARTIATPYATLKRGKFGADAASLKDIVQKEGVGGLVIGWPMNMDGSTGARAQSTRQFAYNLLPVLALPVLLWDERMSTMAVTRTMLDADLSRARRGELVDKMAAAYMLQSALDRMGHG